MRSATKLFVESVMAGVISVSTFAKPVFAVDIIDDPVQIEERVTQVMQTSNALCWEMYRYHQAQAGYPELYRATKEIWSKADQLRAALLAGPVETEVLIRQATELDQMFVQVEKSLSEWGPGDRSSLAANAVSEPRTVVREGVGVDIPFVGIRVGGPSIIVEEGVSQLQRLRVHANSRGSKRSLERELAALKVAISYLEEDAGVVDQAGVPASNAAPAQTGPTPIPPTPDASLNNQPTTIPSVPKK